MTTNDIQREQATPGTWEHGGADGLQQLTEAWAALNRAGLADPIAGVAELIDRLAAERDTARDHANAARRETAEFMRALDTANTQIEHLKTQIAELPCPNGLHEIDSSCCQIACKAVAS